MEKYDLIVLGATFSGIGAAVATPNSLIIERSTCVGWDYIGSFSHGPNWHAQLVDKEANRVKSDLHKLGILTEKGVNFVGVSHYLSKYIIDKGVSVLFMTDVVDIQQSGDIYEIEMVNESGKSRLKCDDLYDSILKYEPKRLNAILCCEQDDFVPEAWRDDIIIENYVLRNTAILSISAVGLNSLVDARKKMHDIWDGRPKQSAAWKIGWIARGFDTDREQGPLQAFEAGYRRGTSHGKNL